MYRLTKQITFESAHQLKGHAHCGFLHGHSYLIDITIESETVDDEFGFVIDFGILKDIINPYDHSGNIITISCEQLSEDIAKKILEKMQETLNSADLKVTIQVKVHEGRNNAVEYILKT